MIQAVRQSDDAATVLRRSRQKPEEGLDVPELSLRAAIRTRRGVVSSGDEERDELRRLNRRLAEVSAESAELMASLEERNTALDAVNRQLAKANAHGAELMAEIDARNGEINRLNSALAGANARASEVLAELAIRKEQLEETLVQLKDEQRVRALVEDRLIQKQKLEALGTLAGGVAHEVNNPLTLVMMNAQILSEHITDETDAERLEEILDSGNRIARVIRGVQSFATSEEYGIEPVSVHDMVEDTLPLLEGNSRKSDGRVTVDVPEVLPVLECRKPQVQQVVLNLLKNARDALQRSKLAPYERRIHISAQSIEAEGGETFVRISVADNGGGVPPGTSHRVFDPFYSTKNQVYGAGLGLSVSYRIAQSHGGSLSLDADTEGWTIFHLDLPLVAREGGLDD